MLTFPLKYLCFNEPAHLVQLGLLLYKKVILLMVRMIMYDKFTVGVVQELLLWGYREKEPHVATWQVMWSERRGG